MGTEVLKRVAEIDLDMIEGVTFDFVPPALRVFGRLNRENRVEGESP